MENASTVRTLVINPNWAYLIILVSALISASVIYIAWTEIPETYGF